MQPIPNEHIARSVTRNLLNIVGMDGDERYEHTIINRITPASRLARWSYGSEVRSQQSYQLTVNGRGAGTLKDALVEWATPERLDGDNCYRHDKLGKIEADCGYRLGELPDTLLVHLARSQFNFETGQMDIVADPVSVPITLNCAEFSDVLETPSEVQYNLIACVVGRLRRRTPDDNYIWWHALIRVPGAEQWHCIAESVLAQGLQYTTQRTRSTECVRRLLNGETGHFCMRAWYQKANAVVQVTTPSVAAWENSWREDLEYSVRMDNAGGMAGPDVTIGIPFALSVCSDCTEIPIASVALSV